MSSTCMIYGVREDQHDSFDTSFNSDPQQNKTASIRTMSMELFQDLDGGPMPGDMRINQFPD